MTVLGAGEEILPRANILPADQEEVRLLDAVSKAASDAATGIVFKGLIGFAAISVAGMATRRLNLGFVQGVMLVSGVSFVASAALKSSEK